MSRRVVQRLPIAVPAALCRATRTLWPTGRATSAQTPTTPATHTVRLRTGRVPVPARAASSASSTRWKTRQGNDSYAREAKLAGLKSRAAFKLLEINDKYRLFKKGDTVVDLGFAPGSWSQVAANRTSPGGRVVGIDVIPAQPPKGVSTLQGDFLSSEIREELRKYVLDPARGRPRMHHQLLRQDAEDAYQEGATQDDLDAENKSILELEKAAGDGSGVHKPAAPVRDSKLNAQERLDEAEGRVVDVVLSDMSEPWPLVTSTWIKSVSNPWRRMMNTSGMAFRDHAGSMDLCLAALDFGYDTLATGGHFLCKFYQGAEDHALESRLKKLFEKCTGSSRIRPGKNPKRHILLGFGESLELKRRLCLVENEAHRILRSTGWMSTNPQRKSNDGRRALSITAPAWPDVAAVARAQPREYARHDKSAQVGEIAGSCVSPALLHPTHGVTRCKLAFAWAKVFHCHAILV